MDASDHRSDVRFTAGILNLADAARYLAVARQTFHRWAKGYERGEALIHTLDAPRRAASVAFIGLTEAFVLDALREAGVRLHKIRPAISQLQTEFGREYVLSAPNLATDGIDVLWDFSRTQAGAGLIEARTGQNVIREIVADHMQYVTWQPSDDTPAQLQLRHWEPSKVIVNPHSAFGQPRFGPSGPRVADVAAMLKAGETAEVVGDEYGISTDDVRTAARVLLGRAS